MRAPPWTPPLAAALLALAAACGGTPRDASPAAGRTALTDVEHDTETACARTRSAGAWTQVVFRTATWRDLAVRADARDPAAWDAIGDLIDHNRTTVARTACTATMVRNVRASADRLR